MFDLITTEQLQAVAEDIMQKVSVKVPYYGECSTEAATAIKTVACDGYQLLTGNHIDVKFAVTNTAAVADLQLNINNTGAKSIKYQDGNLLTPGMLAAGRTYTFVYDGTCYQLIGFDVVPSYDPETELIILI